MKNSQISEILIIINECINLAQKEDKIRHDWVRKSDPLEMVQ